MIPVLILVEGRPKKLNIKRGTLGDLRSAFTEMCEKDAVLARRLSTHFPTFQSHDDALDSLVEIEPGDTIVSNQKIQVYFARYSSDVEDNDQSISEHQVRMEPPYDSSQNNSLLEDQTLERKKQKQKNDITYLNSLGIPFSLLQQNTPAASASGSTTAPNSNKESATTSGNSRKRNATRRKESTQSNGSQPDNHLGSDDSEPDDYSSKAAESRQANALRLQQVRQEMLETGVIPKHAPKLKKKPKGKENKSSTPVEKRVMPTRAVKCKPSEHRVEPVDPDDFSDESESEAEQVPGLCDDSTPHGSNQQTPRPTRRKPETQTRIMGKYITKATALPQFPEHLKDALSKGLVYVSLSHTRAMNNFLIAHMKRETGTMYLLKKELALLKTQVLARLKEMKIKNLQFYERLVIKRLSESIRSRSNHERNRKPRLAAQRAARVHQLVPPTSEGSEQETEAEEILRKPVVDRDTVKMALHSSKERETFIKSSTVKDSLFMYPYLTDAELFVEDYTTRVPIPKADAEVNFDRALLPLASLFEKESGPENELQKLQLCKEIDIRYTTSENHWPCIRICYEIQGGVPVDDIPRGQSPAIVVVINDKDLKSVHLIFDGEIIISQNDPTAFQAIALLLGAYFVFDIGYPEPYSKQLRILELIIHSRNPHSRETEVKTFMRKLNEAREFLLREN